MQTCWAEQLMSPTTKFHNRTTQTFHRAIMPHANSVENNNNVNKGKSRSATHELTLADIAALIESTASKSDINGLTCQITEFSNATDEKINNLKATVGSIENTTIKHNEQIS